MVMFLFVLYAVQSIFAVFSQLAYLSAIILSRNNVEITDVLYSIYYDVCSA